MSWPTSFEEAIQDRILRTPLIDCWIWQGPRRAGYGRVSLRHQWYVAHRVCWELRNGPIPEGLVLDHLCRVELCVNPDHLEPTSSAENVLRGVSATFHSGAANRCRQGHSLPDEYYAATKRRRRKRKNCVTCAQRRNSERKRAVA